SSGTAGVAGAAAVAERGRVGIAVVVVARAAVVTPEAVADRCRVGGVPLLRGAGQFGDDVGGGAAGRVVPAVQVGQVDAGDVVEAVDVEEFGVGAVEPVVEEVDGGPVQVAFVVGAVTVDGDPAA